MPRKKQKHPLPVKIESSSLEQLKELLTEIDNCIQLLSVEKAKNSQYLRRGFLPKAGEILVFGLASVLFLTASTNLLNKEITQADNASYSNIALGIMELGFGYFAGLMSFNCYQAEAIQENHTQTNRPVSSMRTPEDITTILSVAQKLGMSVSQNNTVNNLLNAFATQKLMLEKHYLAKELALRKQADTELHTFATGSRDPQATNYKFFHANKFDKNLVRVNIRQFLAAPHQNVIDSTTKAQNIRKK